MPHRVPDSLKADQAAVEERIFGAFRGVTRSGGISWTQAVVVDDQLDPRTMEQAEEEDIDTCWEDLVDDPAIRGDTGIGGFSFLDPIGFRYYLAPAMIQGLRRGHGNGLEFVLCVEDDFRRNQVSLFNAEQADAVARFVRFMIRACQLSGDSVFEECWRHDYQLYWRDRHRGPHSE